VYGKQGKKTIGYVLLLCLLIAGLDEFYQGFIPGRNPAVVDSLIDFGGAFIGMVMYVGIGRLIGKQRI
jgi:VanZ family protein